MKIEAVPEGSSLAMQPDGSFAVTDFPTPGLENTAAGYAGFCDADTRTSPLLLWEIVVYEAGSPDWVELKNVSDETIDLSGYTISDKFKEPARDALPAVTLAPGESYVFECENVGLSAQRDELYLFDASGTLCDWAFLRDIPAGGSYGRLNGENGYFYFAQSSRGADNGTGCRMVAAKPTVDIAAGVYDDAESLTLTITGENVHYTLDGSDPTADDPGRELPGGRAAGQTGDMVVLPAREQHAARRQSCDRPGQSHRRAGHLLQPRTRVEREVGARGDRCHVRGRRRVLH